jgi:hypothetical protein
LGDLLGRQGTTWLLEEDPLGGAATASGAAQLRRAVPSSCWQFISHRWSKAVTNSRA